MNSLEGLFLFHFLFTMSKLQEILTAPGYQDESERFAAFNLQSQYLLHLIPDEQRRNQISDQIDKVEKDLIKNKKYEGEYSNKYVARLLVVSEIVQYLTESLDLIHSDILGSVTRKAADIISLEGEFVGS